MHYLEAVLDPQHEEHAEMIEWRGPGFHPSRFSIDEGKGLSHNNLSISVGQVIV